MHKLMTNVLLVIRPNLSCPYNGPTRSRCVLSARVVLTRQRGQPANGACCGALLRRSRPAVAGATKSRSLRRGLCHLAIIVSVCMMRKPSVAYSAAGALPCFLALAGGRRSTHLSLSVTSGTSRLAHESGPFVLLEGLEKLMSVLCTARARLASRTSCLRCGWPACSSSASRLTCFALVPTRCSAKCVHAWSDYRQLARTRCSCGVHADDTKHAARGMLLSQCRTYLGTTCESVRIQTVA